MRAVLTILLKGTAKYNSYFGRGSSSFVWINVAGGCNGTEQTLLSCPRNPNQTSCSLSDLAGVSCSVPCKLNALMLRLDAA